MISVHVQNHAYARDFFFLFVAKTERRMTTIVLLHVATQRLSASENVHALLHVSVLKNITLCVVLIIKLMVINVRLDARKWEWHVKGNVHAHHLAFALLNMHQFVGKIIKHMTINVWLDARR